jgi:hypothetical protein
MRRRGHVIPLRLNEREYRHLCEQVKISGLSREEYLRSLILDKEIHPRPCTHHAELVRQISGLCNNANQLAHRANSTGVAGQQSVDEMTRIAKEVWRISEKAVSEYVETELSPSHTPKRDRGDAR